MKRILLVTLVAVVTMMTMTGCGAMIAMGGGGLLYQDTKAPANSLAYYGPTSTTGMKNGSGSVTSILGILVTGDASLETAMRSAQITKLHHVDTQITSILGIISTYKIIVYGE